MIDTENEEMNFSLNFKSLFKQDLEVLLIMLLLHFFFSFLLLQNTPQMKTKCITYMGLKSVLSKSALIFLDSLFFHTYSIFKFRKWPFYCFRGGSVVLVSSIGGYTPGPVCQHIIFILTLPLYIFPLQ